MLDSRVDLYLHVKKIIDELKADPAWDHLKHKTRNQILGFECGLREDLGIRTSSARLDAMDRSKAHAERLRASTPIQTSESASSSDSAPRVLAYSVLK